MKSFLKDNWFRLVVILLLTMIYGRLEKIADNTFYTADVVDASSRSVVNTIQDTADDSGKDTLDALYEINDTLDRIRRNQ